MKRSFNRKPDDIRPIEIKAGIVPNANGSAMVRFGNTVAIAAVYGPRSVIPRHKQESDTAILNVVYNMVPFSTKERARPGPSRRSKEICKVTRQALEEAVFLSEFPKTEIDIYIDILEANAGTRTAGINAASVALADAGIPMKDMVVAVAAGKIGNEIVIDLEGEEEDETMCDVPIAYIPKDKKVTLLQLDGDVSAKELKQIISAAIKACDVLYEKQKEALRVRYIEE